jgi:lipopolysaccharide biosynthesis glycosyltransferase
MKLEDLVPSHRNAVLLTCDQAYLPAARFVAARLLAQQSAGFDVVVMTFDCTPEPHALLGPRVKAVDVEPGAALRALPLSARHPVGTCVRLSAIDSLRGLYRRVLYLDCDLWIGTRAIERLFDLDLDGHVLGAVRDAAEVLRPLSSEWSEYRAKLGVPKDAAYFNSGVMLVDVDRFSDAGVGAATIEYLSSGKFAGHMFDQSALNAVLAGRWLEISPIWNWMFGTRLRITERYDPAIVHFIGGNKPWKDRKAKHHPRYRAEMEKYLTAPGDRGFVEPVPAYKQWRRLAVNHLLDAKRTLVGDRREANIHRFMETTRFADVETGIVARSW